MHSMITSEGGTSQPPLVFLRQLMGVAWIDAEVFGQNPKHLLGQWWKKGAQNPWVAYTESLAQAIFSSDKIQLDRVALAQKLKADYVSTLAEMETAVFLLEQGFSVVLEPTYPEKGPDLRADWEETPYFIWSARLEMCQWIRETLDKESIWDEARSTNPSTPVQQEPVELHHHRVGCGRVCENRILLKMDREIFIAMRTVGNSWVHDECAQHSGKLLHRHMRMVEIGPFLLDEELYVKLWPGRTCSWLMPGIPSYPI